MIVETLVTTVNADGSVNIAPMGPWVADNDDWSRFELRPFQPSQTLENLKRDRAGVVHITDDVYLFAQAIVDDWRPFPELFPAKEVPGWVLANACRYVEFAVDLVDDSAPRAVITCHAVHVERCRDFGGFNRARHAVIEAAILASRKQMLPAEVIAERFDEFRKMVERTGGSRERLAFDRLQAFVAGGTSDAAARMELEGGRQASPLADSSGLPRAVR